MSKAWSERSNAERARLEAEFVLRHAIDMLLDETLEPKATAGDSHPPEPDRRPALARLYAALLGGGPLSEDLSAALAAAPAFRADFSLLVERCALAHLPRAAAAASPGALERREAGGYTLRLIQSRAGDGQVYLLIELPEAGFGAPAGGHGAKRSAAEAERTRSSGQSTDIGEAGSAAPGCLIVKTAAGTVLVEDLPPPETRTIRLLKAGDDPVVRAVGEPASEIYLL